MVDWTRDREIHIEGSIDDTYDHDPSAGNDPTETFLLPSVFDSSRRRLTLDINQIAAAISHRINLPATDQQFVVTISPNTLTANIAPLTGITYTHWIITVDTADTPSYPTGFTEGSLKLTKDADDWGTTETWRLWVYDTAGPTGPTEILAPDGTSGVDVTPFVGAPTKITDFLPVAGTLPETEVDFTFTASDAHPDSSTILYNLVDTTTNDVTGIVSIARVLMVDVSTSDAVTNLEPNAGYEMAINAYNAADSSKSTLSNVVEIQTAAFGISIDTFTLSDAIDDDEATFTAFTSIGIDEYITQIDDQTVPATDAAGWTTETLPTVDVTYVDFSGYDPGVYTVYIWGRHHTSDADITLVKSDQISVFSTTLIPDGDFDTDAATTTAWDNVYGSGTPGGIFGRTDADVIVAVGSDEATLTNTTAGEPGRLEITIPVTENTEYTLTVAEINNTSPVVIDIDDTSLPNFNSGNLVAGQVINNTTDTETAINITSGGGGSSVIEAFAQDTSGVNDAAHDTDFGTKYPNWVRVQCYAKVTDGIVTLTATLDDSGYIYYDDTVVDETDYTYIIDYRNGSSGGRLELHSTGGPHSYASGDLWSKAVGYADWQELQREFTAISTTASYSVWINSQFAGATVQFQNPRLSTGTGTSNVYVCMYSQSSGLGDGFKIPRIYMNAIVTPSDFILQVDFSNRSAGAYTDAQIKEDFHWGWNGYSQSDNPNWNVDKIDLIADPADDGHGVVMRITRPANQGWGGMEFRADLGAMYDDVYLAYDMYLDAGHEFMHNEKNPGFGSGPHRAPHNGSFLRHFYHVVTSDGDTAWSRGDGALSTYYYDMDIQQRNKFWNEVNLDYWSFSSPSGDQYHQPTGVWITIECRVKWNTYGVKDGLQEIWVTDPGLNGGVVKKVSTSSHIWEDARSESPQQHGVDWLQMVQYYGGDGNAAVNQPSQQQYHYYDNFRVSTNPITH